MSQLKLIYESGDGISQSLEERFQRADSENPRGKYGTHEYKLSDFGLSREDLVKKNADYYKLYNSLNRSKKNEP
jgi:hypothetical protein